MTYLPDLNTRQQVPSDGEALSSRIVMPAPSVSAFGVLVANPESTVVELQFPYGILGEYVNLSSSNGGYTSSSGGLANVTAGTSSNGYSSLESKHAIHYVAGTGGRFKAAGYFVSGGLDSSTQTIGVGDEQDGFFFGYSGSMFGVLRRNDGTENWVSQTSWSLDRMDGTGPSRQVLDPTKGNVYSISYQWLGFGAITYLVECADTGMLCPVHRVEYANANTSTSIRDPNLPLRLSVRQWGATGSVGIRVSSMAGMVEGQLPVHGIRRSGHITKAAVSAEVPLISIQNTGSFNGRTNRMRVLIDSISVASRDNTNQTTYRVLLNPTLTGPSWTPVSASNSPLNIDSTASAVSGGREIFFIAVGPNGSEIINMSDYQMRLAPNDILTLTCSGSNSTCVGGGAWLEEL